MNEREPSRTAFGAARHRAAHQLLEQGRIFSDPLAVPILGQDPAEIAEEALDDPSRRPLRFFIAARSEFAEATLGQAVGQRGVRQLVVLGAGLDTFAYRNPFADLRVFEVDHPATQAWKRRRLAEAEIAVPEGVVFAPVDFERDSLLDRLEDAGLDPGARAFFTWLGVVPYLSGDAVAATLGAIASLPGGGEVVFDCSDPPGALEARGRAAHDRLAERVAAAGEPLRTYFEAGELGALLQGLGFSDIADLGPRALVARHFGELAAARVPQRGGRVVHAATAITQVPPAIP